MIKPNGSLIAAVFLMAATGAMANEPQPDNLAAVSETVRFKELDLAKPAGAAALHWRLRMAGSRVCSRAGSAELRARCRTHAVERALADLPGVVHAYHVTWKADGAGWWAKPQLMARQRVASSP